MLRRSLRVQHRREKKQQMVRADADNEKKQVCEEPVRHFRIHVTRRPPRARSSDQYYEGCDDRRFYRESFQLLVHTTRDGLLVDARGLLDVNVEEVVDTEHDGNDDANDGHVGMSGVYRLVRDRMIITAGKQVCQTAPMLALLVILQSATVYALLRFI